MSTPAPATAFISTYGRAVVRGKRTALLVHGAGMDQSVWTLQGRHLAFHGWNALAVDLPGHGRSRALAALPTIDAMGAWLAELIATLESDHLALVGHSMGAFVALEAAARLRGQVRSLCLLGAALTMPVHPELLERAARGDPGTAELMVDWGFGQRGHVGGSALPGGWLAGTARSLILRCEPTVLHGDLAACNAYTGGAAAAGTVRCATLVLIGGQDRMTPPRGGRELAASLADARVQELPEAGHMMMLEQPDETLRALNGFLDPKA